MPSAQHNHSGMQSRDPARFRGIISALPELFGMVRGRLPDNVEAAMYYADTEVGLPPEATHAVLKHIVEVLPTSDTEPC